MFNDEIEKYVEELLKKDASFKMWTRSKRNFLLAPERKQFGQINIIDFFDKKEAILIDQEFLDNGSAGVMMLPVLVLDSNVVGALHSFVTNGNAISESLKQDVKEFINSLILDKNHKVYEHNHDIDDNQRFYDLNPFFYVMECMLKDSTPSSVIDCLKSVLSVQMLDHKSFKESNGTVIKKDLLLEQEAIERHGTFDINIIAEKIYESFINDKKSIRDFKSTVNYIYLLLLKIGQINLYEELKTPAQKLNIVKEYFTKYMGAFSAREIHIAMYYFTNKIGSFIPTGKQNTNDVLKIIYNSAIDVCLLRMPEFMLHIGNRREVNQLAYPVTIEKHLITIGNANTFQSLYSLGDKIYTMFRSDATSIEKSKDFEKMIDNSKYFNEESFLKRFSNNLLDPEEVENKIRDIELSIIQIKKLKG